MAFTFPTDSNNKAGAVRQNKSGTGFHVPIVKYKKDGITPYHPIPFIYNLSSTLTASEEKNLLNEQEPFTITHLEWGTNAGSDVDVRLISKNEDGSYTIIGVIDLDSFIIGKNNFNNIANYGSSVFSLLEYDSERNKYKATLKEKLHFPFGGNIAIRNSGKVENKCVIQVLGVKGGY